MLFALASCLLLTFVPSAPARHVSAQSQVEITFKRFCGLPEGRKQVYDPQTGIFHIHFRHQGFNAISEASWFEVTKLAGRFAKPIVFRLTGIEEYPASPLRLYVGDRMYELSPEFCDKALFRAERKDGVTTIEFTEKGRALLKPGAYVEFTEVHW